MPDFEILFKNKYCKIGEIKNTKILYLDWLPETKNMTDDDFKLVNLEYAEIAVKKSSTKLIVNTTKFFHNFSRELQSWRIQKIIPLYHKAGVTHFAFVHSEGTKLPPNNGNPVENEIFLTKHFDLYEDSLHWIQN